MGRGRSKAFLRETKDTWRSSLTLFLPCVDPFLPCVDISTPFSSFCFGKYKGLVAAVTNACRLWLKTQKRIVLSFWRLEG